MNDKKLKLAFAKIKKEYSTLSNEITEVRSNINSLSQSAQISEEIKEQLKRLDKIDLESFVNNMETEFKQINRMVTEFNNRFKETSLFMKNFSSQLERYHLETENIKQRLLSTQNRAENVNLDVGILNDRFSELQGILTEKLNLEIGSLRLEFTEEIAKIYDAIYTQQNASKEFSKNSYEEKKKVSTKLKEKKKEEKKSTSSKPRNESKIKKAVKWLFIDEEEENSKTQMKSIKDEVQTSVKQK